MRKPILTITTSILLIFSAYAQDKTISGTVYDKATNIPLPFANIGIVGKAQGTITNSEGHYLLSLNEVSEKDSIYISYVGYENKKLAVSELKNNPVIPLKVDAIVLSDFSISSRELSPEEILDSLMANYEKNHPKTYTHQEVFSRDASQAIIHESNLDFKKSSFKAVDGRFIYEFNEKMPEQLNVYGEYLADLYTNKNYWKLVTTEGQTLVENWNFDEEFNKRMDMLADDLENDARSSDNYFKVRSGIFAGKLDFGADTSFTITDDSLYLTGPTKMVRADLHYMVETYGSASSKRWDFFSNYKLYNYKPADIGIVNNELAYIIKFSPDKRKGKYEGTICISVDNFALLQVDYNFAEDKSGVGMSLLGVEYEVINRGGRAIFEKGENGYYIKYILRESEERFAANRMLSIKQKQKKSGADKTLQEVKVRLKADATYKQQKELLVISHRDISKEDFNKIKEPATSSVRKVKTYSPEIWKNNSIIEPTKAMKEYKQQF